MLEGPRLKIKRANKHIADLNETIDAFVKTDFYSFRVERDANTGQHSLQFAVTKDSPCELPLIIGDAIHNLRSALDLAYCEALLEVGQKPTDYSRFIFDETRDKLVSKLNSGPMRAAPDIVTLIADVIKPYATANNPLYALHSLDITDKHLLLIPIFGIGALRVPLARIIGNDGRTVMTMTNCTLGVEQGGVLKPIGMPGKFDFEGQIEPIFAVGFGQGQALEGHPVIPALHQLSQLVAGALTTFEGALQVRKTRA